MSASRLSVMTFDPPRPLGARSEQQNFVPNQVELLSFVCVCVCVCVCVLSEETMLILSVDSSLDFQPNHWQGVVVEFIVNWPLQVLMAHIRS